MAGLALSYMALAVVYSLLAAAVLETLLYLWRVRDPAIAIRLRLLILAVPPLAPILFALGDPEGQAALLRQQAALLQMRNWLGTGFNPTHPGWVILMATMAGTTAIVAVTEAAGLLHRVLDRPDAGYGHVPMSEKLREAIARLEGKGLRVPPVLVSTRGEAMAYTAGLRRPAVVVSHALVEMLDSEELEGVLAHEMAHLHRRDNWIGWLHFGLRVVSFYNPVALFTFHQISHDVERVCDTDAARLTGQGLPLAAALIKVYQGSRPAVRQGRGWPDRAAARVLAVESRARRTLVEDRVVRLMGPAETAPIGYASLRVALGLAAIVTLSYLVVL